MKWGRKFNKMHIGAHKNMIKIKIHSIIDVITNSSTVVYVQTHDNTIKYTKELINTLLKITGSDKKVEDLFDFYFDVDRDSEIEKLSENYINDIDSNDINEDLIKAFKKIDNKLTGKKLQEMEYDDFEKVANKLLDKIAGGKIKPYDGYGLSYNEWDEKELIIKQKNNNKLTINLTQQIKNIFELDGERDG